MQNVRSLGRVVKACVSDDIGPSSSVEVSCEEWCNLAVDAARPESSDKRNATSASSCHELEHEYVKEEKKWHDLPNCPNPAWPWRFL